MSSAPTGFIKAMQSAKLNPPSNITPGKIVRFPGVNKDSKNQAGWCKLFEDSRGGVFGDWSSDINESWHFNNKDFTSEKEKQFFEGKIKRAREKVKLEKEKQQQLASKEAKDIWEASTLVTTHPYIEKKKVKAHGIRSHKGSLVIPIYYGQEITSLQFIKPSGEKMFLSGSRVKDCYFPIGNIEEEEGVLCVVEGHATGASIHEATGFPTLVAFNCGNLESVAKMARKKYPNVDLVICADDDFQTEGNPGLSKANHAALIAKARVAKPKFDKDRPEWAKDFNDMAVLHGSNPVKQSISNAIYPEWPNPLSLNEDYPEEDFPLDMLPEKIRLAIEEVADFVQAPIPLVVSSALGALSLAIQGRVDVARDKKLVGPCSLFLLTIAESGERKTACDKYFTRTTRDYEREKAKEMESVLAAYKAECTAIKAQQQGIELEIKKLSSSDVQEDKINKLQKKLIQLEINYPKKPKIPRLIYNDVTTEALKSNLANTWPSSGIMSNEAGIVFGGHAMKQESITSTLGTFNILWDGGSIRTDRQVAESNTIENARLTISLQVQEAPLKAFARSSGSLARGMGLFARFLIAWPRSTQGTRLFKQSPDEWPHLDAFNKRILELLHQGIELDDAGGILLKKLKFAPIARDIWSTYHNEIEKKLGASGQFNDIKDVASKAAENIARLAVLLHVFKNGVKGDIQEESVNSAIAIIFWYLGEAKRFFGKIELSEKEMDVEKLNDWLIDHCRKNKLESISRPELQRYVTPIHLRKKENLDPALEKLQKLKRILIISEKKKKTILINPKLLRQREP